MSIGSILLSGALLLIVALYVGRPFLRDQFRRRESMDERQSLTLQKEALLEQIRILDFELETGKMPEEEHARQRAQLLHEAADVLKALDRLGAAEQVNGSGARADFTVDREIEAAIAAARRAPAADHVSEPGPDIRSDQQIEAAVQQLRRPEPGSGASTAPVAMHSTPKPTGPASAAGRFCSQCGNPRDAGDKFCAYCGFQFV
jgi:hypothetical protein